MKPYLAIADMISLLKDLCQARGDVMKEKEKHSDRKQIDRKEEKKSKKNSKGKGQ